MSAIPLVLAGGAGAIAGSKDPRLGLIALKIKCTAPDLASAILGPLPDIGIAGLVENQPRVWSVRPGGTREGYDVEATLEGHLTPEDAEGVEYGLEGTTSEDPVETNPEYEVLLDVYGGTEGADGKAKWPKALPVADGEEDQGRRNPMHGVESYLVPGLTWSRKSVARFFPSSLVRSLGTIDTPPGSPPEIEGGFRNWLKIRIRATWRGNVWMIEETWLLSGPDGWVPEMYREH